MESGQEAEQRKGEDSTKSLWPLGRVVADLNIPPSVTEHHKTRSGIVVTPVKDTKK